LPHAAIGPSENSVQRVNAFHSSEWQYQDLIRGPLHHYLTSQSRTLREKTKNHVGDDPHGLLVRGAFETRGSMLLLSRAR
jgi:hypothetical protein